MQGECELCGEKSEKLQKMLYNNAEPTYLCPKCWDYEGARGDMEYERQREEYDPDDPGHERDIKEERC